MANAWGRTGVLLVALASLSLMAGCTSPSGPTEPLLQETLEVGEPLFGFGEAEHFGPHPSSAVRRINGTFDVAPEVVSLGVGFQGTFDWSNSTASLEIRDPQGEDRLELFAERGREDDEGTIAALFEFHRLVGEIGTPGQWRVLVTGTGNISSLDFQVHGLHAEEDERTWTFEVPSDDVELRLRLEARGWGETPSAVLEEADASTTPLDLTGPRGEVVREWTGEAGEHTLRLDPSGWGGRILVQVVPV